MKKLVIIFSLGIMVLVMGGCGAKNMTSAAKAKQNVQNATSSTAAAQNQTSSTIAGNSSDPQTTPKSTNNSGVVAKSSNAVSSQDKEDVLNQLDKELDSLFSSVGKMDDVQDTDLNLN